GNIDNPVTWLFEPDSFTPMAKLVGDEHYSIIADHLGTPSVIFDKNGQQVWSSEIDVWGNLRQLRGERNFCPFRFPGQYEDDETGLYYNRFRYYDPQAGQYVSQDLLKLNGGYNLYGYVPDATTIIDPLGLSSSSGCGKTKISPEMEEKILRGERVINENGTPTNRIRGGHSSTINDTNPDFAVEVLQTNPDGTQVVKFVTQFPDGNLSKIKKSTLFPASWSDQDIISATKQVGDTSAVSSSVRDGVTTTTHHGVINNVKVEVLKIGDDVVASYPTGGL